MTDRQAKHVDVEATWKMALKGPHFPLPHGTTDLEAIFAGIHANLVRVYEDNVAYVFAEIIRRELEAEAHRRKCLKVFMTMAVLALLALFLYYLFL